MVLLHLSFYTGVSRRDAICGGISVFQQLGPPIDQREH